MGIANRNIERAKKPWPTKNVMQQIYELNLWGEGKGEFYSGLGSHDEFIVGPYLREVITFLKSFKKTLKVVDLGCGDFNVGRKLVTHCEHYIAVDIVPDLIGRNQREFKANNLEFKCLDIAKDDLPTGDCVILRQVLQHLSNVEVRQVVDKLSSYRYILLTEHLPEGDFIPNLDIISGQGIRLKKGSGLDLLKDPFNLKINNERILTTVPYPGGKGVIVTKLYQLH